MTWNNPKVRFFDEFFGITGYIRTDIFIRERGTTRMSEIKWVIIGQVVDSRGVVHNPRLPRIQN